MHSIILLPWEQTVLALIRLLLRERADRLGSIGKQMRENMRGSRKILQRGPRYSDMFFFNDEGRAGHNTSKRGS